MLQNLDAWTLTHFMRQLTTTHRTKHLIHACTTDHALACGNVDKIRLFILGAFPLQKACCGSFFRVDSSAGARTSVTVFVCALPSDVDHQPVFVLKQVFQIRFHHNKILSSTQLVVDNVRAHIMTRGARRQALRYSNLRYFFFATT